MPRVIVTDELRSYGAAHRDAMPSVEHRSPKGLNRPVSLPHLLPGPEDALTRAGRG